MKNSSISKLIIPLALIASGCASKSVSVGSAGRGESRPFVGTFKVHRFQYENGLKLLVVEDHTSPTFAYQTWFSVGSRDEIPGKTGLAHLFEHMMFKGTKDHKEGEFDRILEQAGVEGENAFTSRDFTAYVQELPKDKLDLIAQLEADRMVHLVVNENSFKTEREVVQNERRFRDENNPDGTMYQEIFGVAFKKHPYRWPVIGYTKDLNEMVATDASKFYKSHYSPNHATIIVSGDVDPEAVSATVLKNYGELPAENPPTHLIPKEPRQIEPRFKNLKLNIQVDKLLMGYHIPGIADPDVPALRILQNILTGGKASRLYRALVNTGIASNVDTYDLEDKDPSLLIISVNLQKKEKASEAERVILRELEKIAKSPVSADELFRAKNRNNFLFNEGLASNNEKASFLGHFETIAGDFSLGIRQQENTLTVTKEDIQQVASKYFNPHNRTVIAATPKGAQK